MTESEATRIGDGDGDSLHARCMRDNEKVQAIYHAWAIAASPQQMLAQMLSLSMANALTLPIDACAAHADYVTKTAVDSGLCMTCPGEAEKSDFSEWNATSLANLAYIATKSQHDDERAVALEQFDNARTHITPDGNNHRDLCAIL